MLHNWTCQLVFIEPEKDKESGELEEITQLIDDKVDCATSTPRKRRRSTPTPHLPRTVFYSRLDGKVS